MLTGDASSAVEKNVMRRYEAGLYAAFGVNLEEIDVLKVSHHGSDAATSAEFLSLLAPDCAVISVGAAIGRTSSAPFGAASERGKVWKSRRRRPKTFDKSILIHYNNS